MQPIHPKLHYQGRRTNTYYCLPKLIKDFTKRFVLQICDEFNTRVVFPPMKYCTDNGVMIAWNGLEKYRKGLDIIQPEQVMDLDVSPKSPLGIDISTQVTNRFIKCKWIKIIWLHNKE